MYAWKNNLAKTVIAYSPFSSRFEHKFPSKLTYYLKELEIYFKNYALAYADRFDVARWEELQLKRLKPILRHAAHNVVYWQRIFKMIGFDPDQFTALEDIQRIPIVTRSQLKQIPLETLIAENVPNKRLVRATTSGSTGEPLTFYHDRHNFLSRRINVLQEFRYAGIFLNGPILILGLTTHVWLNSLGHHFTGFDLENEVLRKTKIYPLIEKGQFRFVISTPSLLERLVHFVQNDKKSFTFLGIRYVGESLSPRRRQLISGAFRCILFGTYATKECGLLAMECPEEKFHLAPWMNYIEIVDSQGKLLPHDEEGRIIVTFFENYVMPFIRYDIGDRGIIHSEPCPCGRKTKTITFTGRAGGSIETPSGKSVMLLAISSAIAKNFHDTIARFQLEQTAPDKLIFRFIPSARYTPAADKQLTQTLQSLLYNEIHCEFDRVPVILPNSEGKTPIFIKSF